MRPLVWTMVSEGLPSSPDTTGPVVPPGPSPPYFGFDWEDVTQSACLARGPVLFWGIVLSDALTIVATVHDGVNAAGRNVCSAQTTMGLIQTMPILLTRPLLLQNGLYLELSATPDDCLVLFDLLPTS